MDVSGDLITSEDRENRTKWKIIRGRRELHCGSVVDTRCEWVYLRWWATFVNLYISSHASGRLATASVMELVFRNVVSAVIRHLLCTLLFLRRLVFRRVCTPRKIISNQRNVKQSCSSLFVCCHGPLAGTDVAEWHDYRSIVLVFASKKRSGQCGHSSNENVWPAPHTFVQCGITH